MAVCPGVGTSRVRREIPDRVRRESEWQRHGVQGRVEGNSVDMTLPTPVVIANGMVFALGDGDDGTQIGTQGNLLTIDDRKAKTGHAILDVLDAVTGKVIYSSGDTIKGFYHFSGLTVQGGKVYLGTWDGTLYAFQ